MTRRKTRRARAAVILVGTALLVSACGSSTSSSSTTTTTTTSTSTAGASASSTSTASTSGAQQKQLVLGFINVNDAIPYGAFVKQGMVKVANQLGVKLISCDSSGDAQKAIACAQEFKAEGVQGIANFQIDITAAPRVCAAGPHVPVVAIDSNQPPCQTMFYGANNYHAGYLGGQALGQLAKSKFNCQVDGLISLNAHTAGKIVIEREDGEIDGFHSLCASIPATKIETDATEEGSLQPSTDALSRLPGKHRIMVLATNDDQARGMIKAAQTVGRAGDIYISAQNADNTIAPYYCGQESFKGMVADVGYFPEDYGQTVVPALIALVEGKKEPPAIYINHRVVNAQNIRQLEPGICG